MWAAVRHMKGVSPTLSIAPTTSPVLATCPQQVTVLKCVSPVRHLDIDVTLSAPPTTASSLGESELNNASFDGKASTSQASDNTTAAVTTSSINFLDWFAIPTSNLARQADDRSSLVRKIQELEEKNRQLENVVDYLQKQ
jgi:hypothetical protein